jgi:glycosyltransferase involved in cell wall biosynthesis
LTDEIISFLAAVHRRERNAFSMILTQRDATKIENLLLAAGLQKSDFSVSSVSPQEIPRRLKAADVAISFIKSCYSKKASSPTKIAEYLASGLPIVSNSGIGDLDSLIDGERVGVILSEFSSESYDVALAEIESLSADKNLREHCRNIAYKHFDLATVGGESYRRLYRKLLHR